MMREQVQGPLAQSFPVLLTVSSSLVVNTEVLIPAGPTMASRSKLAPTVNAASMGS